MFLVFKCRLIDVDQMLGLDAAVFGVSYGSLVGQDLANGSKMEIYRHGDDASSANEGRLFGALLHSRFSENSQLYHGTGLFNLSIPALGTETAPEIFDNDDRDPSRIVETPKTPRAVASTKSEENLFVHTITIRNENLRPYFSMTTKHEFTDTIYLSCKPYLYTEADLINLSVSALKGVSSSLYNTENGHIIDKKLPVVILPGYSPTSIRKYIMNIRKYYLFRLLLSKCIHTYLNYSKEPCQLAMSSIVEEVLYLIDASMLNWQNTPIETQDLSLTDLNNKLQLYYMLYHQLLNVISPPEVLEILLQHDYHLDCDVNESVIRKYCRNSAEWLELDSNRSWELFNKTYAQLKCRRDVTINTPGMYEDPTYTSLVISSLLLRRVSVPILDHLTKTLFNMSPDYYNITNDEISSMLTLSANHLWSLFIEDGNVTCYLMMVLVWTRTRNAILKLNSDGNMSLSINVHELCRADHTDLLIPLNSTDTEAILFGVNQGLQRLASMHRLVSQLFDSWIDQHLGGRVVADVAETASVVETEVTTSVKKNEEEASVEVRISEEEAEPSLVGEEVNIPLTVDTIPNNENIGNNYETEIFSTINTTRMVDSTLVDEAREEMIRKYEQSMSAIESKRVAVAWQRNRIETAKVSRQLISELYDTEQQQWNAEYTVVKLIKSNNGSEQNQYGSQVNNSVKTQARVSQQPGGNTELNLADNAYEGSDNKERATVRVSQQPGGNTELNLADNAYEDRAAVVELPVSKEDVERARFDQITSALTKADTSFVDREIAMSKSLSILSRSVLMLAKSNDMFGIPRNSGFTDDLLHCTEPLFPIVKNTMATLVKIQSQVLDQAVLYSSISDNRLFHHIDAIDNLFLLTPTSDFLMSFVSNMLQSQLDRYPLHEINSHQFTTSPSAVMKNKYFWDEKVVKKVFSRTLHRQEVSGEGKNALLVYDDSKGTGTAISTAFDEKWEVLFDASGLDCITVRYMAPWPLSVIFSTSILDNIGVATRRLLALGHVTDLFRLVWNELRVHRGNKKAKALVHDRELFHYLRAIQQTIQALFDFTSDRIRFCQLKFRGNLKERCNDGLGGIAHAIYQYSNDIATTTFAAVQPTGAPRGDDMTLVLAVELDALLTLCRTIMKDIMCFIKHYSADNEHDAQNMNSIRVKMQSLGKRQGKVYRDACSGIDSSNDANRVHINVLILFFGVFNINVV